MFGVGGLGVFLFFLFPLLFNKVHVLQLDTLLVGYLLLDLPVSHIILPKLILDNLRLLFNRTLASVTQIDEAMLV